MNSKPFDAESHAAATQVMGAISNATLTADLARLTAELAKMKDERDQFRRVAAPAVSGLSNALVEMQQMQDELERSRREVEGLRADAAIGRLVREKLTSGNSVPVERCTVRAAEIAALSAGGSDGNA